MKLINRRTFLKSLATVCGATVVCPGELLKGEPKLESGFYDFNPFGSEANRKKYRQNIIIKARQQDITNPYLRWKNYYADHQFSDAKMKEQIKKLRAAFKVHPFEPPFRW